MLNFVGNLAQHIPVVRKNLCFKNGNWALHDLLLNFLNLNRNFDTIAFRVLHHAFIIRIAG